MPGEEEREDTASRVHRRLLQSNLEFLSCGEQELPGLLSTEEVGALKRELFVKVMSRFDEV